MNTALQQVMYNNSQTAYKQTAVDTSSPQKLVAMLYSRIVLLLHQADKALEEKRYEESNTVLLKVQNIISELDRTLDMDQGGEIAQNLRRLYNFYYMETVKANIKKDPAYLQPVIIFFETFRDLWLELAKTVHMGAY